MDCWWTFGGWEERAADLYRLAGEAAKRLGA
jgi:hypothetical protein